MPKVGKPQSKRVPVRLRHKIEKASAAKQRKQRKLAKKDPTWRSKIKKDPGIPNLFPYKDRILEQVAERKRQQEEEKQRRKDEARASRTGETEAAEDDEVLSDAESAASLLDDDDAELGMDVDTNDANPMAALLASAKARAAAYDERAGKRGDHDADLDEGSDSDGDAALPGMKGQTDPSSRAYTHLFSSVLSSADVILYVLDARDPPSTRSLPTERQIAAFEGGSRRLLLVLNKIDLVPPQALKGWLTYLRRYHPTLPLRASAPASSAKVFDHKILTQRATAETLLKALKAYATSQNLKRALTVGVVGFPNVGKSSVINALVNCLGGGRKRGPPATTGAEAGVTTSLKSIKLDGSLTLLDSPGVVFPEGSNTSADSDVKTTKQDAHARLVLLNALPPRAIDDPIPAVSLLLRRLEADGPALEALLATYGVPALLTNDAGDRTTDFLVHVARKRGRLGRGGIPNLEAAGKCVLQDWRDGRIAGWVEPPALELGKAMNAKNGTKKAVVNGDEKAIVGEWAEEFSIEGLWEPSKYKGTEPEADEMEM